MARCISYSLSAHAKYGKVDDVALNLSLSLSLSLSGRAKINDAARGSSLSLSLSFSPHTHMQSEWEDYIALHRRALHLSLPTRKVD